MNTKFDAGLTDPTKISVHQTAEPAQPVAWYVERRAPGYGDDGVKSGPWWSKNEAKRFADDHHVLRPLYAAPQPPADEVAEPAQPVAWRSWTGQCGYGYWESQTDADLHSDPDYRPVPLYTADAIREAVEAEREACASLIEPKNPRSDWTEYAEARADCAAMIRARGAA